MVTIQPEIISKEKTVKQIIKNSGDEPKNNYIRKNISNSRYKIYKNKNINIFYIFIAVYEEGFYFCFFFAGVIFYSSVK